MKEYKLSVGKATDLYNKCIRLLGNLNFRTPRPTIDIVYGYVSLARTQLYRQRSDGEAFRELECSLDIQIRIADTYYHFNNKGVNNVSS